MAGSGPFAAAVIAEEQVRPRGCVRKKPELGGVDGFINHSQAEANKDSTYTMNQACTQAWVCVLYTQHA